MRRVHAVRETEGDRRTLTHKQSVCWGDGIRRMCRGTSRKRGRGDGEMMAFGRPRTRIKRAHDAMRSERGALAPSGAIASVAAVAYERLCARDGGGAARALATLIRRYRRNRFSAWYFPHEVVATSGALGRRDVLSGIARDGVLSSYAAAASGAASARAVALVDAALGAVADGKAEAARDMLAAEAALPAFERCFIVQLLLGVLSLVVADATHSAARDALLADADAALGAAAALNPGAFVCAHASAAVEIRRGRNGVEVLREFGTRERQNAFAQRALLRALRALPRPPRQEVVDTARALAAVDPIVSDAFSALREACGWGWEVEPAVTRGEVAAVAASAVEHAGGDAKSWSLLASCVAECGDSDRIALWSGSGRDKWWPQHFFRVNRLNYDRQYDGLVGAKVAVARLFDASIPYVAAAAEEEHECA